MLDASKVEANTVILTNLKMIPPAAFYTALPQLISRVILDDKSAARIVQGLLGRVLTKFPKQAMWPLAWLKGSKNRTRKTIGEEIFNQASRNLSKSANMQKLLLASGELFRHFQELAM